MINVLVVDDQNLTHQLIKTYLEPEPEIEIVGFATNGQEAVEQATSLKPDIVLMDVEMPMMSGLAAAKIITQNFPLIKVLMLTVHDNEMHLSQALQSGAKGYLLKTTSPNELKNAIQYANQGYFQLSLELTEKYLYKIMGEKSDSELVYELKSKMNYLDTSLSKLELKLSTDYIDKIDKKAELIIEEMLQKEIILLRDHDSHLQFKVDQMKNTQKQTKKNISDIFKIQLVCILIAVVSLIYSIFLT